MIIVIRYCLLLLSVEMRHSVATPLYLLKRALDRLFAALTTRRGTPRLSLLPAAPISVSSDARYTNGFAHPDVDADAHIEAVQQQQQRRQLLAQEPLLSSVSVSVSVSGYGTSTDTDTDTDTTNTAHLQRLAQTPFPTAEPRGWVPLYTMVTFRPDVGYAVARAKAARQQRVLTGLGWGVGAVGAVGLALTAVRVAHRLGLVRESGGGGR